MYVLAPQNFTPRKYGCGLADRRRLALGGALIDRGELEKVPAVVLAGNIPGLVDKLS